MRHSLHGVKADAIEREAAIVRRLAHGLFLDRHGADDLAQEAWVAALGKSGGEVRSLRSWLMGTMRRLALQERRDRARRWRRELTAARAEELPSAADSVGRIEVVRRLLDAVEALPEPYRSTIVERFFDDLPPRVIARRRGLPVNTVRTHLRRGLAELRRRLDTGEEQSRRDFLTALAPLLASPSASV